MTIANSLILTISILSQAIGDGESTCSTSNNDEIVFFCQIGISANDLRILCHPSLRDHAKKRKNEKVNHDAGRAGR